MRGEKSGRRGEPGAQGPRRAGRASDRRAGLMGAGIPGAPGGRWILVIDQQRKTGR